ncbi:NUDIX domain-containing protein [Paraburkholderia sp. UCT31]|uniref:NUDIX domain-containing protein n=1 Tax=Paraburkholderia sp. UCT31 TaxID=2615209 RepID=UPI0016558AD2|nr:NUDIX domain-containing protein [Paraburkholderia sp. UCT31]MBC8737381.1 NUDIX domain-containing protein [Paraburkholderia sp. UCT31]
MPYKNPLPVAVAMVPVMHDGRLRLFGIVRGHEPGTGLIALPGGYVDELESIEEGVSRELDEEAHILYAPDRWKLLYSAVTPQNRVLVFCVLDHVVTGDIVKGRVSRCREVWDYCYIDQNTPLAFPLHEQAVERYYRNVAPALRVA